MQWSCRWVQQGDMGDRPCLTGTGCHHLEQVQESLQPSRRLDGTWLHTCCYMAFACGISNYSVGVFHVMNHAFFKVLLFLSAGSCFSVGLVFTACIYSKQLTAVQV